MGCICSKCYDEHNEVNLMTNIDQAEYSNDTTNHRLSIVKRIKVRVRDLKLNEIIQLEFENTSTIENFREKLTGIFSKTKIHHLMYGQSKLKSGILKDYGIRDGSLIDVVGEVIGNWAI